MPIADECRDRHLRGRRRARSPRPRPHRPAVRPQQLAEQPPGTTPQQRRDRARHLLVVLGLDAAPSLEVGVRSISCGVHAASSTERIRAYDGRAISSEWVPTATSVPSLEQRHPVGQRHRRRAMHDQQRGRVSKHRGERFLDERLGVDVERRQRVVQHQHRRARDDRAGQGKPLPLPAGQRQPFLADPGVEPPRQLVRRNRACATASAASISSSVASGRPSSTFSRTLIENSTGSSNTVAICCATTVRRRSRTSTPSRVIRPAVTSYSRDGSADIVVLPDPVAPTIATVSPGSSSSVRCREAGRPSASSKRKPAPTRTQRRPE